MLGLTAEQIGTVLVGASLAISAIMGGRKGRDMLQKQPVQSGDVMEVAGAIVSDKGVDKMVRALDEFTSASILMTAAIERDVTAKTKLTAALTESSHSLNRNSEVSEEMRDEIKETGSRLEGLTRELIRSGVRRHD